MGDEEVQCPICSKQFSKELIEAHASKCLFLNESVPENQGLSKRKNDQRKSKSPVVNKKGKSGGFKRSQGHSSSQSIFKSPLQSDRDSDEVVEVKDEDEALEPVKPSRIISSSTVPLAERMRPSSLSDYIGQTHVIGERSLLLQLLSNEEIPNVILWGPPGCGKTSLANVIASICKNSPNNNLRYVKLSASMSGVADIKSAATIASNELRFGRKTVIFMDEIHRFSKAQQDIFLPHIEAGTITLIGATTENPSFSLNDALLSRCRVIVLEKLTSENLEKILVKALASLNGILHKEGTNASHGDFKEPPRFIIDEKTIKFLSETCDGDARIALGGLELAVQSLVSNDEAPASGPVCISLEDVQESLKKTHMLYDRKGDQHYDIISALHKSVRASDENASLYWLTRMMAGGEDPVYIARRMVRAACEDIGLADPKALGIAVRTMHACKMMGMPECDVLLAQLVVYLAKAPKCTLMDSALKAAKNLVERQRRPQPSVPLHLRSGSGEMMKGLDFGRGLTYLPEGLEFVDFFDGRDPVNGIDD